MMSKILKHVDEHVKKFNYTISERERDELVVLYELNHEKYDEKTLALHIELYMQRIKQSDRSDWSDKRRHSVVAKKVDATGFDLPTFGKTKEEHAFLDSMLGTEIPFSFLSPSQKNRLIASMYPLIVEEGIVLIQEGEIGSEMYIIEEGEFEVLMNGVFVKKMPPRTKFGELALLHEIPRTATVRATQKSKVWAAEQTSFSCIRIRDHMYKKQLVEEALNNATSMELFQIDPSAVARAVAICNFKVYMNNTPVELMPGEFLVVFRDTVIISAGEKETPVHTKDIISHSFITKYVLECGIIDMKSIRK